MNTARLFGDKGADAAPLRGRGMDRGCARGQEHEHLAAADRFDVPDACHPVGHTSVTSDLLLPFLGRYSLNEFFQRR